MLRRFSFGARSSPRVMLERGRTSVRGHRNVRCFAVMKITAKLQMGDRRPRSLSNAPLSDTRSPSAGWHFSRFSQSSSGPPSPGWTAKTMSGDGALA